MANMLSHPVRCWFAVRGLRLVGAHVQESRIRRKCRSIVTLASALSGMMIVMRHRDGTELHVVHVEDKRASANLR